MTSGAFMFVFIGYLSLKNVNCFIFVNNGHVSNVS